MPSTLSDLELHQATDGLPLAPVGERAGDSDANDGASEGTPPSTARPLAVLAQAEVATFGLGITESDIEKIVFAKLRWAE